jgi:threonine aldolase
MDTGKSAWTIDLISDTSTRPSPAMFERMRHALVGDEQLGEDPTTRELEERVASLLGQESAVFLPSGTMCNQIALLVHCRPGDEIIASRMAHIFGSEGAGAAALAGSVINPVDSSNGIFSADDLRGAVRPRRDRSPRSRLVVVEQTSNRGGGAVWPLDVLDTLQKEASAHGLALHIDGARLFNAAVASGVAAREYGKRCDSIWIDFSKGLGCPFGAVLAGSRDFIKDAWRWKHRLGGAMRQSGFMAAACLYALDNNVDRLVTDHENARLFATIATSADGVKTKFAEIETNIVFLDLTESGVSAAALLQVLRESGMRMSLEGPFLLRAVTHLDVSAGDITRAGEAFVSAIDRIRLERATDPI